MIINTSLTIAYKCPACGSFEFSGVSLFALMHNKECGITCHCNKSTTIISLETSGDYKIRTGCIGCGNEHIYIISRKEMLSKNINIFHCPETGIQLCFIGKDEEVRRRIDRLEKELDELIDMFGYESYFKNTRVMFDSLNRVHDIAEQGDLVCECGNHDIELRLLSDRIHLQCKKCPGNIVIFAASNEDLKKMQTSQQILLSEVHEYANMNQKRYIRKTDGK